MAPPGQLHTLDRTECLRLLGTVPVGRIVFAESALPAIHPVNFTLDGADVIIRTRGGGKFAAAVSGSVVAFEADEIDPATRSGWSEVRAELHAHIQALNALRETQLEQSQEMREGFAHQATGMAEITRY